MSQSLRTQSEKAADFLKSRFPKWQAPCALIQTGSGFDGYGIADQILGEADLHEMPGMPPDPSPAGHPMRLVLVACQERQVLLCLGRRHLYEGHGPVPCVLPACAAKLAGIHYLAFVCAAGGVNSEYRPGTVMVMADYINNLGVSPLTGNGSLGNDFFPAMNNAFSQPMISSFINAAADTDLRPRLGVYQANPGPQFETPAEVAVARRNGADAVGMSTVLETIAAHALGAQVLGVALITNVASSDGAEPPAHREVQEVGRLATPSLTRALRRWLVTADFHGSQRTR